MICIRLTTETRHPSLHALEMQLFLICSRTDPSRGWTSYWHLTVYIRGLPNTERKAGSLEDSNGADHFLPVSEDERRCREGGGASRLEGAELPGPPRRLSQTTWGCSSLLTCTAPHTSPRLSPLWSLSLLHLQGSCSSAGRTHGACRVIPCRFSSSRIFSHPGWDGSGPAALRPCCCSVAKSWSGKNVWDSKGRNGGSL